MNLYAVIILSALFLELLLNFAADILNLRAVVHKGVPPELEGVYDEDAYRKAQDYLKVNTRFDWIASAVSLAAFLGFWYAGGFNWLDLTVSNWTDSMIAAGILYIGILAALRFLLSLPFAIYQTFRIEARFGFNKTTPKTFVIDRVKGLLLSALLGVPLLAGILAFFHYAGGLAWVYCWLAVTLFTLIVQFVAPRWIMPLFNKFQPLEAGELRNRIEQYADRVDFPLQGVYVIDGSRRSTKSNAFFTGFGKHKRIALFDTLLERHTDDEIVAVLAHEIGHYRKKHIVQGLILSIVHSGAMFFLLSLFLRNRGLYEAFFMARQPLYAGFVFFAMLYSPIELVLSVALHMLLRHNEYEADCFAVRTSGLGTALIEALRKLAHDNLANLTPHPFYVFLHYSHPPMVRRIRAIQAVSRQLFLFLPCRLGGRRWTH